MMNHVNLLVGFLIKLKTLFLLVVCACVLTNMSAVDPSYALSKIKISNTSTSSQNSTEAPDLSNSAEEEVESGLEKWGIELITLPLMRLLDRFHLHRDFFYSSAFLHFIHRPPAF
jgi:hypothetical protein